MISNIEEGVIIRMHPLHFTLNGQLPGREVSLQIITGVRNGHQIRAVQLIGTLVDFLPPPDLPDHIQSAGGVTEFQEGRDHLLFELLLLQFVFLNQIDSSRQQAVGLR